MELTASWVEPDIYNITHTHVLIEPEPQAGIKLEPRDPNTMRSLVKRSSERVLADNN